MGSEMCIRDSHAVVRKTMQRRHTDLGPISKSSRYWLPWENGGAIEPYFDIPTPPKDNATASDASAAGDDLGFRPFSGNDQESRHIRLRCAHNLANFNTQPLTTTREERTEAWNEWRPYLLDTSNRRTDLWQSHQRPWREWRDKRSTTRQEPVSHRLRHQHPHRTLSLHTP